MRGWLIAAPEDEYRAWLARAETDSRLRYDPADATTAGTGRRGDAPDAQRHRGSHAPVAAG